MQKVCLITEHGYFLFDGGQLQAVEAPPSDKEFCGSFLRPDDFASATLKLPPNTDEESFDTEVELAMYRSAGLDPSIQYKVAYQRAMRMGVWDVEAFAAEEERLRERFGPLADRIGHLDFLGIPYVVYEGLYATEERDSKHCEIFLRFGADFSFAVLYLDGTLLSYRQLPSMEEMAKRVNLSMEALEETLRTRGLDTENYPAGEELLGLTLTELMDDYLRRVRKTMESKRVYLGARKVETVVLDFEGSGIPGFWKLCDGHGLDHARKEVLDLSDRARRGEQHRYLEALYLWAVAQRRIASAPNLTIFGRPLPWYRTATGQFAAATLTAVLLMGGMIGWSQVRVLEKRQKTLARLETRYQAASDEEKRTAEILKALTAKEKQLRQRRNDLLSRAKGWEHSFEELLQYRRDGITRREMLRQADKTLERYKLKADRLSQVPGRMTVRIFSPYGERAGIALFMQEMKLRGYRKVTTRRIQRKNRQYDSEVVLVR